MRSITCWACLQVSCGLPCFLKPISDVQQGRFLVAKLPINRIKIFGPPKIIEITINYNYNKLITIILVKNSGYNNTIIIIIIYRVIIYLIVVKWMENYVVKWKELVFLQKSECSFDFNRYIFSLLLILEITSVTCGFKFKMSVFRLNSLVLIICFSFLFFPKQPFQ